MIKGEVCLCRAYWVTSLAIWHLYAWHTHSDPHVLKQTPWLAAVIKGDVCLFRAYCVTSLAIWHLYAWDTHSDPHVLNWPLLANSYIIFGSGILVVT